MRITYDGTVDCGYIYLRDIGPGEVTRTIEVKVSPDHLFGSLNVDVDADGRVCGIEVLGVSSIMPRGFAALAEKE